MHADGSPTRGRFITGGDGESERVGPLWYLISIYLRLLRRRPPSRPYPGRQVGRTRKVIGTRARGCSTRTSEDAGTLRASSAPPPPRTELEPTHLAAGARASAREGVKTFFWSRCPSCVDKRRQHPTRAAALSPPCRRPRPSWELVTPVHPPRRPTAERKRNSLYQTQTIECKVSTTTFAIIPSTTT